MMLPCIKHGLASCTLQGWAGHKKTELNWKLGPKDAAVYSPRLLWCTPCLMRETLCFRLLCHFSLASAHAKPGVVWEIKVQKMPITWKQYLQLDPHCQAGLGHPAHPASLVVQASLVALPCQAVPDFPQAHGNRGLQDCQPVKERE